MFYGEPRQIEIGNDPARQAEASMIEGLLMKHAMADFQKLFTDPAASRQMVDDALARSGCRSAIRAPVAPLSRFLGELDTFLGSARCRHLRRGPDGWQPVRITKLAVARERQRADQRIRRDVSAGRRCGESSAA